MRHPNINIELARELAQNALYLKTLREAIHLTAPGSEQAVVYIEAINPLLEEKEHLIEKAFYRG